MSVIIKVKDRDDIRRLCIPRSTDFEHLKSVFAQLFGLDVFVIKYVDDENDLITLSCDEEVQEALRLTKENAILRMYISRLDGAALNVSSFSNLSASSSSIPTTTERKAVTTITEKPSEVIISTTVTATEKIPVSAYTNDLAQKLAQIKFATENVASSSVSLSNQIASDVSKLSEQTAAKAASITTEVIKKSEDLANKTSSKASELSKNIATSTAKISTQVAAVSEQLSNKSVGLGEQIRKETMERSLLLSEQTSENLNRISDSTVGMVDDASERIRALIMNIKV